MTEIVLVRHGHTQANAQDADVPMSGATNVPLATSGFREAHAISEILARERPFSRIYSSPLDRALDTARIIAGRCELQLEVAPLLGEINCGEADGLRLSEVRRRYPDHWRCNLEQKDPDFRWPGGESYQEFRDRILRGLGEIVCSRRNERLIVVTHSGVISQVVGWVLRASPAEWGRYRPRTGSITELEWGDEQVLVRRFDELPSNEAHQPT